MRKQRPKVIDLFAGVGGLSLGASRAGFDVAAAVEIDKHAVAAHSLNFPNSKHIGIAVGELTGTTLLSEAGLKISDLCGLIGGPPCQGFSTIGRRDLDDPRNTLFAAFFQLVAELKPAFFVAENVPGILGTRNDAVRLNALAKVPPNYVLLAPIKVKASAYGAPTIRTRVFFIGYDPTRVRNLSVDDFLPREDITEIRVGAALQGIPELGATWETTDGLKAVARPDDTYFGKRLKALIPPGVGHAPALKQYKDKFLVSGFFSTEHTPTTVARFNKLSPGKSDKISKSVRLDVNGYCPTLRAGTGPEKGSYQAVRPVHPTSPRVICPREAARLQGFPDWFQFDKTKWHAFRQIGNSVSPIVAEAILGRILQALKPAQ
jgi:DNA (cytosine-5)-methyltransferase 1